MRGVFIKLHISILLAGFTGLFGKIITLNEGLLVWYRMFFASLFLFMILWGGGKLRYVPVRELVKIGGAGVLLAFHWVFFYGSIKASNVSIGVICYSLVGFFTAILEPLINRRRFVFRELLYSLLTVGGIALIFQLDTRYRLGITLGIVSSALSTLFTISSKRLGERYPSGELLTYEMVGGYLCLTCLLPLYLHYFPVETMLPDVRNLLYLLLLSSVCTIGVYLLQIQVLKKISAFTVNLSYNLEPVYSIILAMCLFGEAKELNFAFYMGLVMIIGSVLLQTRWVLSLATRQGKPKTGTDIGVGLKSE